jgi:hypothetical protein
MAFPSSQGSRPVTLAQALDQITATAGQIKQSSSSLNAKSLVTSISSAEIIGYVNNLASQRTRMVTLATTPDIGTYAQAQYSNNNDIVAAYTALISGIDAVIFWIVTNFPKDGNGFLLERTLLNDGTTQPRMFQTSDLAGLRTQLQALVALID